MYSTKARIRDGNCFWLTDSGCHRWGYCGRCRSGEIGFVQAKRPVGRAGCCAKGNAHAVPSVDDAKVFIGSFNFDLRSARLNTELGFIVDSPNLAETISEIFLDKVPKTAYEVWLSEDGGLYWLEHKDGQVARHDSEPGASIWRRMLVAVLSHLPIEWLL